MIILLIFSLVFQPTLCAYASSNITYYARVMMDNVYLYRQPIDDNDINNKYFIVPKTYFVELTNSYNEIFYEANYMEFKGYIKKESVKAVAGTPENAFLSNVKFRVFNEDSRDLRASPSAEAELLDTISSNSRNITFIGKIFGTAKVDERPNIWFFCKYTTDFEHIGYVYADYCDDGYGEPVSWNENSELVAYIDPPNFEIAEQINSLPIENKTTAIIIAILSIPALVFVFLVIKGSKLIADHKKTPNKEIKDY